MPRRPASAAAPTPGARSRKRAPTTSRDTRSVPDPLRRVLGGPVSSRDQRPAGPLTSGAGGREEGGADRAGVLAEGGEAQAGVRAVLRGVEQFAEPALDRVEVEVRALGEAAPEHEDRRIERVREVDQAERDPAGELVDHGTGSLVALLRRSLHVLTAHERDVAASHLHDP